MIKQHEQLYQNTPNPFNNSTEIGFLIEEKAQNAFINIYDLQGKEIHSYKIDGIGESKINIQNSDIGPGMFYYSLIINNQVIDTKQMVVLK